MPNLICNGGTWSSNTNTTKVESYRRHVQPESNTFPSYATATYGPGDHKPSLMDSALLKNVVRSAWASRLEAKEVMPPAGQGVRVV